MQKRILDEVQSIPGVTSAGRVVFSHNQIVWLIHHPSAWNKVARQLFHQRASQPSSEKRGKFRRYYMRARVALIVLLVSVALVHAQTPSLEFLLIQRLARRATGIVIGHFDECESARAPCRVIANQVDGFHRAVA